MDVILLERVEKLGAIGDVVTVKDVLECDRYDGNRPAERG